MFCCSIDGTYSTQLGRYINDAPRRDPSCNCRTKACYIDGMPRILVFAARNISPNEELRYDYGAGDLPWRMKEKESRNASANSHNMLTSNPVSKFASVGAKKQSGGTPVDVTDTLASDTLASDTVSDSASVSGKKQPGDTPVDVTDTLASVLSEVCSISLSLLVIFPE